MGMSASQARLIALTARMNDIEYQGQQINQQRTTLSNQVNALYNQLLEMSVPTPPSTSNYTKVQYSGTLDASKFTLSNIVPTGKNEHGNNTYTLQFNYNRAGSSVVRSNTQVIMKQTLPKIAVIDKTEDLKKTYENIPEPSYKAKGKKVGVTNTTFEQLPDNTPILIKVSDKNDFQAVKDGNYNVFDENGCQLSKNSYDNYRPIYIATTVGELRKSSNAEKNTPEYTLCKLAWSDIIEDENGNMVNGYRNVIIDEKNKTTYTIPSSKQNEEILNSGYYIVNENNELEQIKTTQQLEDALNDGRTIVTLDASKRGEYDNPLYKENSRNYMVGNMPVYSLSDQAAKNNLGSTYENYLNALRNAFPEDFNSNTSLDEIASKFYVYIETSNGTIKPHFIKNDEMPSLTADDESKPITPYDYTADGTTTYNENKKECLLEFDAASGRITKVGIPGEKDSITWVSVTAETVTDQDAYKKAFNDYEYEKNVYDKKQQEINAKTSIVQQQDKSLELKLTRLDNERNAVNTETEAVKKVVGDNIEKSFKTFSG